MDRQKGCKQTDRQTDGQAEKLQTDGQTGRLQTDRQEGNGEMAVPQRQPLLSSTDKNVTNRSDRGLSYGVKIVVQFHNPHTVLSINATDPNKNTKSRQRIGDRVPDSDFS